MDLDLATPAPAAARRRRAAFGDRARMWGWIQLTPAAAYFAALFLGPLAILVTYSFYGFENFEFIPGFSLDNYREVITSSVYRPYFERTIVLGLLVSAIVLVIGYPFAYALTFVFPRRRQVLYFLVLVSLFGGYLVRIYAWRTMLGKEGVLNTGLQGAGVVDHPIGFFLNSQFAVVLTLVNFYLPLGILPIYSAMQNVPPGLLDAGRDLGSGRLHVARRVLLPMTMRGVTAGFAFTFIAVAAEWVTPLLVGGAGDQFVGNQVVTEFGTELNWPLGAALAITLVLAALVVVVVVMALTRRLTR